MILTTVTTKGKSRKLLDMMSRGQKLNRSRSNQQPVKQPYIRVIKTGFLMTS
ncbi:hypothetical protein IMSAGC019_01448 [Lachnospiraceae bacterium]|nr:hypothetical protein IMSAGC019_01448 [Lachnospiraceae bacterium]